MMLVTSLITAAAVLGLSLAAPSEDRGEKRQLVLNPNNGCPGTFQLAANPCKSGQGRVYYTVPGDASKFVQCDVLGRAYVVQCPTGLVYNQATTSCQAPLPVTQTPSVVVSTSPCTAQALQQGQVYFPYPGDSAKFYECTGVGQVQVLQCPQGLVWDGSRIACVYAAGAGAGAGVVVQPTAFPTSQPFTNPCTAQQLAGNHYYFAHPDPTKFIQCDNTGQAFVNSCPSGLVWNQYSEVCSSAFAQNVRQRESPQNLWCPLRDKGKASRTFGVLLETKGKPPEPLVSSERQRESPQNLWCPLRDKGKAPRTFGVP
ncbi:uncharacterized protein LOC143300774 [Babylonia areolata]|uniref:uncharacterized protein LOC143300774 n=1 Tax=Babylonia areolata TaxID=304850 RepID=UPI003FD4ADC1